MLSTVNVTHWVLYIHEISIWIFQIQNESKENEVILEGQSQLQEGHDEVDTDQEPCRREPDAPETEPEVYLCFIVFKVSY